MWIDRALAAKQARAGKPLVSACSLFLVLGLLGACDGDEKSKRSENDSNSEDSGNDSDTSTPFECEPGGGSAGDECDESDLCDCDNVCGDQVVVIKDNAPVLTTYCFARCSVSGQDCGAQTKYCVETGQDDLGICVPVGGFASKEFEMPIFAAGADVLPKHWSVTNTVMAQLGDTPLPRPNAAAGMVAKDGASYELSFVLGLSAEELWILSISVPKERWKPGSYKVGGFTADLYHSRGTEENLRLWYEASAVSGTLELTQTPVPCDLKGGDCPMLQGSIQLGLVGFHTEIGF